MPYKLPNCFDWLRYKVFMFD